MNTYCENCGAEIPRGYTLCDRCLDLLEEEFSPAEAAEKLGEWRENYEREAEDAAQD
jgi:predicted amidophosphoribosyltransferase